MKSSNLVKSHELIHNFIILYLVPLPPYYQGKYPSVRQRSLMNHIERVHLRVKAYECQFCNKKFHSKAQRASHVTLKHREEHHMVKDIIVPPRTRLPPLTGHMLTPGGVVNPDEGGSDMD